MKRILVVSDSHGMFGVFRRIILKNPDVDYIFHLGDMLSDAAEQEEAGCAPVICVPGNNDGFTGLPSDYIYEAEGVKVLLTHGHRYSVNYRLDTLAYRAQEMGAAVALFGHTHRQAKAEMDGVLVANPGAALTGAYAILELDNGKADITLYKLEQ